MQSVLNASTPFKGFEKKAGQYLYDRNPVAFDRGYIHGVHIGRNQDSNSHVAGLRPGFRVAPAMQREAIYFNAPGSLIPNKNLVDPLTKIETFSARATDAILSSALEMVQKLVDGGMERDKAESRTTDSFAKIGYFDAKSNRFIVEPTGMSKISANPNGRTKDSVLSGLQTPFWDVAKLQKVFKQPFLTGYANRLVNEVGVPNIWADLVQIFTETFEGFGRVSNVAHGTGEQNTSVAAKNRAGTMFSEVVNLVIDYESMSPNEQMLGGQEGNWLTNALMSDRDRYANLMLVQLKNMLYYFGDTESGFDGLQQIANRDSTATFYPDTLPPASWLWDNDGAGSGTGPVNNTVGADMLLKLMHMIGDFSEDLQFTPTRMIINCAPVLYKVLKFSMNSKIYNQENPLSKLKVAFSSDSGILGSMAVDSIGGMYTSFELYPDPMLSPNTPFNATDEDLMFITFPQLQSALEDSGLVDLIMAPVLIDNMVLPSAPGYRDGIVRTAMQRVGSLLVPVEKVVRQISGMGTNTRYPVVPT